MCPATSSSRTYDADPWGAPPKPSSPAPPHTTGTRHRPGASATSVSPPLAASPAGAAGDLVHREATLLLRHGGKEWLDEDGHSRIATETRMGDEVAGVEGLFAHVYAAHGA